jgi:2-methylisocitrate lyase-like PEP mutase family enzyme
MAGKIAAAVDARPTAEFAVTAKVSTGSPDLEHRADAYERAGAEALLIAESIGAREVPLIAQFPWADASIAEPRQLTALGFSLVIDIRLQTVAADGLRGVLAHLREVGTVTDRLDRMVDTAFVTDLLGLPDLRKLEQVFGVDSGSTWTPW